MLLHQNLTDAILKAYFNVYNTLGYGFLEKVYENALLIELRRQKLDCVSQQLIKVYYQKIEVGSYFADIVVNNTVILELKAAEGLAVEHECQLLNYLKATRMEVGLLLNFGKKPEFRRKVFQNQFKSLDRNADSAD
ncbi:GxxExxY protein [Larkinella knui]|uniref:GxxExxY protein n=1 Tax=Larkinella knui TaxID=2025310 RepID=A0A3P1CA97_9BACT|nr:GxxExxY protein [Larkinella knui]RRB10217.1 GxxExxY protein [Larkinella knui]